MRIEIERVSQIDAAEVVTILLANESRSRISSVHVEPNVFQIPTDCSNFVEAIERTRRRRPQSRCYLFLVTAGRTAPRHVSTFRYVMLAIKKRDYEEWNEAFGYVLFYCRFQSRASKAKHLVTRQQADGDTAK